MASEISIHNLKPYFDGTDYPLWKQKMEFYLDSDQVNLWTVVLNGWTPPMKDVDGAQVTKPRNEWSKEEIEANGKNRRAVTVLLSSMSREECSRVQRCDMAKEVWKALVNYHKGTTQVRQQKCQMWVYEYEIFKCKPNESVTEIPTAL